MTHPANTIPWHLYNDFPHCDLFIDNLIIVSEANKTGEHWTKKSKRHNNQKEILKSALNAYKPRIETPAHVVFCRWNSRLFDDDNLVSSFKHVKDYFCDYLLPDMAAGRADAKLDITFSYQQCKSKRKGVQITIYNKKEET